jgi:hypothetical protein
MIPYNKGIKVRVGFITYLYLTSPTPISIGLIRPNTSPISTSLQLKGRILNKVGKGRSDKGRKVRVDQIKEGKEKSFHWFHPRVGQYTKGNLTFLLFTLTYLPYNFSFLQRKGKGILPMEHRCRSDKVLKVKGRITLW